MCTKLKVINGTYVIKSVNTNGDTVVHLEAWYVDNCRVQKWYCIEPKTEVAKVWFENNGYPNIRKDYMVHTETQQAMLSILKKAEKEL